MKRHPIIAFVLAIAICVAVLGFVRGWIELSTRSNPGPKVDIQLTIDPDQVKKDAEKVKQEADRLLDKDRS